tara:strand:- start:38 stop:238 length:201 start_codon:yes stop_codon:yes gene_type:complete
LIALSHIDLAHYYKLLFAMKQHHRWSIEEMEMMIPWEREIYAGLLQQFLEEERDKQKAEAAKMRRK